MSLLKEAMETVVLMDKTTKLDSVGGQIHVWTEGIEFEAAIISDTSIEARIGQVQGVKSIYTVTLPKNIMLEYHDVFKRISDGKVFRVTSDWEDKQTPSRATFQFNQVTAEEWALQ